MCSNFLILLSGFMIVYFVVDVKGTLTSCNTTNDLLNDDYDDNIDDHTNQVNQFNPILYPGNDCYRNCDNTNSRICYFKFVMEQYHAMGPACGKCSEGVIADCFNLHCVTADGIERGIVSINRMIPGPSIHVCKNDLIIIDVVNKMGGESSTIHWHGIHQKKTPFMDGVPFITQCPIDFSTIFRYKFTATESGTQFYHSHTGHHKVDGHYGVLIVRESNNTNQNRHTYQYDLKNHTIIVSDWIHDLSTMFVPGLPTKPPGIEPENLLINGRGVYMKNNKTTKSPLEVFRIMERGCYRFRFINSASQNCPLQIQIEDHRLLVISTDSNLVEPITVDTIISTSGERYDFVLCAKEEKDENTGKMKLVSNDYWIRLRAIGPCNEQNIEQFAILSYDKPNINSIDLSIPKRTFPKYNELFEYGMILNHPNSTCFIPNDNFTCIAELKSLDPDYTLINAEAKCKYIFTFNNYLINKKDIYRADNYEHYMNPRNDTILIGSMNNISFNFPSISILTQHNEINEMTFCDELNKPDYCDNNTEICVCTQRIKIPKDCIVEITIVDEAEEITNRNHPIHLHGYTPYVIGFGSHPNNIPMTKSLAIEMLEVQKENLNNAPPKKDTVSIPSRGYTTIKFKADNPGFWLFHCHYEWHMSIGMALVVQVGELDEMISAPINFPQCRNYQPDLDMNDFL